MDYQRRTYRSFNIDTSFVVRTERSPFTTSQIVVNMFSGWYRRLGLLGCSSHSGRRTFITETSKKISLVGGSLRDIQMMAGHKSLQTTQRYIEADSESQRKVVDIIWWKSTTTQRLDPSSGSYLFLYQWGLVTSLSNFYHCHWSSWIGLCLDA